MLFSILPTAIAIAFNILRAPILHNTIICADLSSFKKICAIRGTSGTCYEKHDIVPAGISEYDFAGITRVLQDADFRRKVVAKISDPIVKSFWVNEFEKMRLKFPD